MGQIWIFYLDGGLGERAVAPLISSCPPPTFVSIPLLILFYLIRAPLTDETKRAKCLFEGENERAWN